MRHVSWFQCNILQHNGSRPIASTPWQKLAAVGMNIMRGPSEPRVLPQDCTTELLRPNNLHTMQLVNYYPIPNLVFVTHVYIASVTSCQYSVQGIVFDHMDIMHKVFAFYRVSWPFSDDMHIDKCQVLSEGVSLQNTYNIDIHHWSADRSQWVLFVKPAQYYLWIADKDTFGTGIKEVSNLHICSIIIVSLGLSQHQHVLICSVCP